MFLFQNWKCTVQILEICMNITKQDISIQCKLQLHKYTRYKTCKSSWFTNWDDCFKINSAYYWCEGVFLEASRGIMW